MGDYFVRPLPAHIAALAALAIMFVRDMTFLGGRNTIAMMAIVQTVAIALHGLAWLRIKRMSFGATSALVVLGLLGPLYTFMMFSLYVFATSEDPIIQTFPLIGIIVCLIYMWLALRPSAS